MPINLLAVSREQLLRETRVPLKVEFLFKEEENLLDWFIEHLFNNFCISFILGNNSEDLLISDLEIVKHRVQIDSIQVHSQFR